MQPPFKKAYAATGKNGSCRAASQYMNALNHSGGWSIMGSRKVVAYQRSSSVSCCGCRPAGSSACRSSSSVMVDPARGCGGDSEGMRQPRSARP